jgi:hypothetical protein
MLTSPMFEPAVTGLEQGVSGQVLAASALKALHAQVEAADIDVDAWYRHHFHYINVEAIRRSGPNVHAKYECIEPPNNCPSSTKCIEYPGAVCIVIGCARGSAPGIVRISSRISQAKAGALMPV